MMEVFLAACAMPASDLQTVIDFEAFPTIFQNLALGGGWISPQ